MLRRTMIALGCAGLLVGATPDPWQVVQDATPGTVILLRHAVAPGVGDPPGFRLDDCATQRNLSEEGRQQARQWGSRLRERGIPVVQVLSSQWCRALDTATEMDVGPVIPFPPLNSFFSDRSPAEAQTQAVLDWMTSQRPEPGIVLMVTHQVNITALTGIVPQSGEGIVVQLNEAGMLRVLGRVSP
ncbi:MAG: histidine phosphatase family protein [Synechococcales cyanobacterium]